MDCDSPSHKFLRKEWPQEFSQSRKPYDERPYLESLLEAMRASNVEPDGDDYQLFMEAYDDDLTTLDVRSAIRYLQAIRDYKLHDQTKTGKKGTAWLDDRAYNYAPPVELPASLPATDSQACGVSDVAIVSIHPSQAVDQESSRPDATPRRKRSYPAPLNAIDLHDFLRERQFDHSEYLDADRRLIYIADPDAYDLSALIKTARAHQERALRDAICKYLALGASIKAMIRQGYSEFQLEFHIPFFAMRRSQPEQDFVKRKKRTHRGWMNISFLDTNDADPDTDGVCGIHQAHISVTISGTDNTRWFVYCFEDRHFDEDGQIGQDEQTSVHQSDQVARGELGAGTPIWDPREYFFRVLLIRICQVQREWEELVRFIETGIKEHSWGRYFFAAARDGKPQILHDTAASTRLDCTLQLLCKLIDDVAKINTAWTRFTSSTGDLAFFLDTQSNPHMVRTFHALNDAFETFREIETRLQRIAAQCEKRAQTVNLRLASDSKRSAELTVYFISPFAIVSTFFAIPVPIIAFDRNLSSFLIAMFLYTIVLHVLLFLWGGELGRQQWWQKLSRRAKAVLQGGPNITTQQRGVTVLQRRSTHPDSVWG